MCIRDSGGDISFYEDTGTTAKLFWDASAELLGIGTTSPQAGLDIESTAKGVFTSGNVYSYPTGNAYIKVKGTNAEHNWIGITGGYDQSSGSANLMLQPNFRLTSEQAGNYIGSEAQSVTTADITFGKLVGGSSTSTNATKSEFMRIDSSGNVGIGTSSPSQKLHVDGGNSLIKSSYDATGTTNSYLYFATRQNGNWRNSTIGNTGNALVFGTGGTGTTHTNATERMRIDSSGNVGIGVSSPASKLHITGTGTYNHSPGQNITSDLIITSSEMTDNNYHSIMQLVSVRQSLGTGNGANGYIGFSTIDDSNGEGVRDAGRIAIVNESGTSRNSATSLSFWTNAGGTDTTAATEKMRIDSSGNVGIGTTSPNAFLDIKGDATSASDYMMKLKNSRYSSADSSGENKLAFGWDNHIGANIAAYKQTSNTTGFKFYCEVGYNNQALRMTLNQSGDLAVVGALSKGSGSFKIDHPLESKTDTHHLVHSFIEGPQADNIYRGKVDLVAGSATANIDTVAGMTEGTFVALNTDVQCFTTNESNWDAVKGSVSGNILTIESQNSESTATISWLVIGERQDQHMYDTDWTDENGKVIVEPLKETETLENA